jgi:hypothetical protein
MSLFDDASLVLTPNGVKSDKVYSIKPTDGSGDLDFTRASSATRVNSDGLIETVSTGVPRLDYPPLGGCPSLLLEPQRTNLIQYSEDFSQWSQNQATIVLNDIISPDGTQNADKLTSTNAFSSIFLSGISAVSGSVYTLSCFFKNATSNEITLRLGSLPNDSRYVFNLSDLSIRSDGGFNSGFVSAKIDVFPNDWFRCSLTFTTATTTIGVNIYPKEQDSVGENSVNLWGAQLEEGSYPTSYIPTVASTVTRVAEVCNGAGDASTFNDSEGVLFAEISALANDFFRFISLSDGSNNNNVRFNLSITANQISFEVNSGGLLQLAYTNNDVDVLNDIKIAMKYKLNDFSVWINGVEFHTDTNGSTPIGLDRINFDRGNGLNVFYGNIKQIQYFDTALTDQELEQLTSL